MKKIKSVVGYIVGICLFSSCLAGCDDMNSLHQQYIDRGEIFYTGKCDSVKAFAGNGRVKFTWLLNSDPRINRTMIYWNGGIDSVEIPVTRAQKGVILLETILPVKEGSYSFIFVTMDAKGHSSLEVERSTQIYGPKYIATLTNRNLSFRLTGNSLTINWNPVESEYIQYTTVNYTDYSNPANPAPKSVVVANESTQTLLPGIRAGDTFSVISTFLPENGLDMIDASPREYTL
jgi:hypothetical protein